MTRLESVLARHTSPLDPGPRLVLAELEAEAGRRGARRVVLSTGPRQPEAVRLYLAAGYTPLFDLALGAEQIVIHPFEKELS